MIAIQLRFLAWMCLGAVHSTKLRGYLRKNHLCLVLVSEISFRLEVWVLVQNRIENAMGKQLNFVSLHTCALVSCIQTNYVGFCATITYAWFF